MLQALHAEMQKAHRRHDLVLCFGFAVIAGLWLGSTAPTGAEERANAYSALFYAVPVINTILLPIMMAVLASRLWDMEAKGCTAKLLYTLQSRRSLFLGKAVFGLGEVVLMAALEGGVVVLLGQAQGYTEVFPALQFIYLNVCTLAVSVMLFFSELLLALWFTSPLPAVCTGIVGALLGLFSAFMPPIASYFVPWGYFVPLGSYQVAEWDKATRTVLYGTRPCNWGLLGFTVVLGAAFFALCWRVVRNKEV